MGCTADGSINGTGGAADMLCRFCFLAAKMLSYSFLVPAWQEKKNCTASWRSLNPACTRCVCLTQTARTRSVTFLSHWNVSPALCSCSQSDVFLSPLTSPYLSFSSSFSYFSFSSPLLSLPLICVLCHPCPFLLSLLIFFVPLSLFLFLAFVSSPLFFSP